MSSPARTPRKKEAAVARHRAEQIQGPPKVVEPTEAGALSVIPANAPSQDPRSQLGDSLVGAAEERIATLDQLQDGARRRGDHREARRLAEICRRARAELERLEAG